jgi:protein-tyrosine phosphatase
LGERLLQAGAPDLIVRSAGLGALVGKPADAMANQIAARHGVSLDGHLARQFSTELGREADLILVMEPGHKSQITRDAPQLSGKTMLFDHWSGAKGIADPYQRSQEFHEEIFKQTHAAATGWAERLKVKGSK